jgi:hypothetical protein
MDRFQVHTNFTATAKRTYEFDLAGLAEPVNLDVLRKLFTEPEALRGRNGGQNHRGHVAADRHHRRRHAGRRARAGAALSDEAMFCMFGEDIGLLPRGVFRVLQGNRSVRPG